MFRSMAEKKVRAAGYDPARLPPGQYLTEKWPVLHAGSRPAGRPRDVDVPRLRRGREGARAHLGAVQRAAALEHRRRTSTASRAGAASTRSSRACTGASSRSSAARSRRARFAIAHAEHGFTANVPLLVPRGRRRAARHPRRRRAADARPRLAAAPRRPGQVLLEERQVAARHRALARRQARLLGALRLQQRRRPVEGGALRVLRVGNPRFRQLRFAIGWLTPAV